MFLLSVLADTPAVGFSQTRLLLDTFIKSLCSPALWDFCLGFVEQPLPMTFCRSYKNHLMWTVVIEFIIQLRYLVLRVTSHIVTSSAFQHNPVKSHTSARDGVFTQPRSVWRARCGPATTRKLKLWLMSRLGTREGPPPGHSPPTFFIQKPRRPLLVSHYVLATRARPSTLRPCCRRSAYGSSKFTVWPPPLGGPLRHRHGQENSKISLRPPLKSV